jgi:hypothetical protein
MDIYLGIGGKIQTAFHEATLHVFIKKFEKNHKNFSKKTFRTFSVNFFFKFGVAWFYVQFGRSRPAGLGGDRERTNST